PGGFEARVTGNKVEEICSSARPADDPGGQLSASSRRRWPSECTRYWQPGTEPNSLGDGRQVFLDLRRRPSCEPQEDTDTITPVTCYYDSLIRIKTNAGCARAGLTGG